jgi:hypothetical protein
MQRGARVEPTRVETAEYGSLDVFPSAPVREREAARIAGSPGDVLQSCRRLS